MLPGSNIDFGRGVVSDIGLRIQNQTTSEQSTTKLFKAIYDENLGDFERALEEGANVNTFNEGMTPLMSIMINLSSGSGAEKEYQSMIRLLLLHRSIDVNICEERSGNTALHLAMCFLQKKVLQLLLSHPRISTDLTNESSQNPEQFVRSGPAEYLIMEILKAETGKELLNALSNRNIDQAKRLLNQELNPNCWERNSNGEIETPLSLIIESCLQGITQDNEKVLTELLKHRELDFNQIKPIPAIEQNSRLKQIIEQAMKERIADAINGKDLGDVKELVEDNCFINRAIVTAALRGVDNPIESITNYLNEKFPASAEQPVANIHSVQPETSDELIARGLQRFENLINELKRTSAQLAEKEKELDKVVSERIGDASKILQLEWELRQVRQGNQEGVNILADQVTLLNRGEGQLENLRDEFERTKTLLRKKGQELDKVVSGRMRDASRVLQLERDFRQERLELQAQNQDLENKNKKLSEVMIYNGRQSGADASFSFFLSEVFTIGTCLTMLNLEICVPLAVAAFVFFTIGCYFSCRASTVLSDVTSTQFVNAVGLG